MRLADVVDRQLINVSTEAIVLTIIESVSSCRWVAIFDDQDALVATVPASEILGADPAARVADLARDRPPLVVFPADLTLEAALGTWQVSEDLENIPDIVMALDGMPVGVWPSHDVAAAMVQIGLPRLGDTDLPGNVAIPRIVRRCQFCWGGQGCGTAVSFAEKPDFSPECPGPDRADFPLHQFVW